MTPKSIAILGSRGVPAAYGGFETFAEELSTRLVEKGVDVTVYCESDGNDSAPRAYRGVNLVHIAQPKLGPLNTIIFDAKCLWHARRSYDVVYMLGYGASLFFFIPRLWGTELWVNMDGIEWLRSKWNFLARTWLRTMEMVATWFASRIIADAEAIRAHLEHRMWRKLNTMVIPYGAAIVDEAPEKGLLAEYGVDSNAYYLVVCRLEPENHVAEIVAGYLASGSEIPLVVVGDIDADTPYTRSLGAETDPRVRFIGTVFDQQKLTALRWHCRAYFHGHSVGGTNPSLLEALGCGNRVVAHDNVFNREVAADCAHYFSCASEIEPIVQELDGSAADSSTREKSQNRIATTYTWQHIVDKYAQQLT